MATPKGAKHQDLEQVLADLSAQVRALTAASLRRRQLGVTEGDFVVSGSGGVVVRDGGGVSVLFPEDIAGDSISTAAYLGDIAVLPGNTYGGTGLWISDHQGNELLAAVTDSSGLAAGGRFTVGQSFEPLNKAETFADTIVLEADGLMQLKAGPSAQLQLGLTAASVFVGHQTTGSAANTRLETNGLLARVTSSRRYKADIAPAEIDPAKVLRAEGRTWVDKDRAGDPDAPRHVGFIAEELHEAGLAEFVEYDDEGRPDAIQYDRLSVGLLSVVKAQQAQLDALSARLDALEGAA